MKENSLLEILEKILESQTITQVAKELNLARGTVIRWMKLDNIPEAYRFDLMKIAGIDIEYSEYTAKQKDQFFTTSETVDYCMDVFRKVATELGVDESEYHFIEPAAGDGAFMRVLPEGRTLGFDIEPRHDSIIKQDYLTWKPADDKKYIVFGNPPFGLRGHLALKFINHSYDFADFVCFILPQLFESDGKGVPRKRVQGYNLMHSEKLETNFYDPDDRQMKINVVYQIWSKHHFNSEYTITDNSADWLKVYSLSDGGSPSTTRNKEMLDVCDVYLPSTCFGEKNMRCYGAFEDLPGGKGYGLVFSDDKKALMMAVCQEIDWSKVSFLSTNSAYNLKTSKIIEVLTSY